MELDQALNLVLKELEEKERELGFLQVEVADLRTEAQGLRGAIERFSKAGRPAPPDPFLAMDRTAAIESVLEEGDQPMSPSDICDVLKARGRDDTYNAVSAALSYLQKSNKVHSVGRGQWLPGPAPRIDSYREPVYDTDEEPF